MRRATVLFLTLVLLWAVIAQIDQALSGWGLSVFAGGLFVAYAALLLPEKSGLAVVMAGGLVCDANAPVAFGTHAFLFGAVHAVLFRLRDSLPKDGPAGLVPAAFFANLALFTVLSMLELGRGAAAPGALSRLAVDLICSQGFVALAGPWFFALQDRSLALTGALAERAG